MVSLITRSVSKDAKDSVIMRLTCNLDHIPFQMQRLPGLSSSQLMRDTLSGRNELIDFDDIFNGKVYYACVGGFSNGTIGW